MTAGPPTGAPRPPAGEDGAGRRGPCAGQRLSPDADLPAPAEPRGINASGFKPHPRSPARTAPAEEDEGSERLSLSGAHVRNDGKEGEKIRKQEEPVYTEPMTRSC